MIMYLVLLLSGAFVLWSVDVLKLLLKVIRING